MTKEIARITKDGDLMMNGTVNECISTTADAALLHSIDMRRDCPSDASSYTRMALSETHCMNTYNLIDAFGIDWRNPASYSSSHGIRYNEREDCIEIISTGNYEFGMYFLLPIYHSKKFNFSCEVVTDNATSMVYVGGLHYNQSGNKHPENTNHYPSYRNYLCVNGKKPHGSWHTYHNDATGGDPVTGISGKREYKSWYAKDNAYFQPYFIVNYNSGNTDKKVTKIRNPRIWYSDEQVNRPFNGIGMRVSGNVRNLCTRGYLATTGTDGASNSKLLVVNSPTFLPDGSAGSKHQFTRSGNASLVWDGIGMDANVSIPNPLGKHYTITALIRPNPGINNVHNNLFYMTQAIPGQPNKASGIFDRSRVVPIGDGWYLAYAFITTEPTATRMWMNTYQYLNTGIIELEIGRITCVEGHHHVTSLLGDEVILGDTSETGFDTCSLNGQFTIVTKFIQGKDGKDGTSYANGIADQAELISLIDQDGKKCSYRYWIRSGASAPFVDPDTGSRWNTSTTDSRHVHKPNQFEAGKEYYLVIKRASDNNIYWQFFDTQGTHIGNTHTLSHDVQNSPQVRRIEFGSGVNWDASIIRCDVLNGYMDNTAISEYIKTRFTVDDGQIRENVSEHRTIPFYMDVDMSKYEKLVLPGGYGTRDHEKTNLIANPNPGDASWSHGMVNVKSVYTPFGMGLHVDAKNGKTETGSSLSGNYNYVDVTLKDRVAVNERVVFSAWVYVSHDWDGTSNVLRFERLNSSYGHADMSKKGQWQIVQLRMTYTQAMHDGGKQLRCLTYHALSKATKGYMIVANAQLNIEAQTLPSLGPGYADNRMTFNLTDDYKVDWSKKWSIYYWKKPIGGHGSKTNGWIIDSLGWSGGRTPSNATSGYFYWGKRYDGDRLEGQTAHFSASTYYNKWRLVVLTYDPSQHIVSIHEIDEAGTHSRTISIDIPTADHYRTTNTGGDLILGGWHTDNCTALYRDLKVRVGTFPSMDSITAMYSEGLRIQKDGTTSINGEIVEGSL